MDVTITITGKPSVLATILAGLPDGYIDSSGKIHGDHDAALATLPAPPTPIAAPAPLSPPMPSLPPANTGDEDEDGDAGPVNTTAPAVDANGLPWDERIHAKTKAMTEQGVWRKRRGVTEQTVATVEAELRARTAAPPAPIPAPLPMPAPVPVPAPVPLAPPPLAAPVPAPTALPEPAAIPAPNPVPAPAPVAAIPDAAAQLQQAANMASGDLDFAQFMQHVAAQCAKPDANGTPTMHSDYLAQMAAEISTAFAPHGVQPLKSITDIAVDPRMIKYAVQIAQRDNRW